MNDFPKNEQLSDALFRKIAAYVYEHARINLTENKRELVRARLGKVIRNRGFRGFRSYYEYMVSDETGAAVREVLNAVSTNLTSFFREEKHFHFLNSIFLPRLLADKTRRGDRRIRAWSAGCSTGEEAYTLAITLSECLPGGGGWDVRILASDIDTEVLEHGERGIYAEDRVRAISAPILRRYFLRGRGENESRYKVRDTLRRMVVFRHLNLMGGWPFRRQFDFIFCRNVMIYFDRPTQQMLVDRFHAQLAPGGVLFIGHSEGLTGINHRFRYLQPTVYEKPA